MPSTAATWLQVINRVASSSPIVDICLCLYLVLYIVWQCGEEVDTGNTLKYLVSKLKERGPKSIKICTMLNKQSRRVADVKPDYIGFEVDDIFVVGYGLDYNQRFRALPFVGVPKEEVYR